MRCLTPVLGSFWLAGLVSSACSEVSEPLAPESAASVSASAPGLNSASGTGQVVMLDACEPTSFNAAFGAEVCTPTTPRSGIRFPQFIELLERDQRVDAWRFAPDVIRTPRTRALRVPNKGGIPHSFNEVAEFGGGFIPLLNQLSGNPVPAPECVDPENPTAPHPDVNLIAPGDHDLVIFEAGVERKYMCCIHPWMRAISR